MVWLIANTTSACKPEDLPNYRVQDMYCTRPEPSREGGMVNLKCNKTSPDKVIGDLYGDEFTSFCNLYSHTPRKLSP